MSIASTITGVALNPRAVCAGFWILDALMTSSVRLFRFRFTLLPPMVPLTAPGSQPRAQENLEIGCPVGEVATGVVTNLPGDW